MRSSIQRLTKASAALDVEKREAEVELLELVSEIDRNGGAGHRRHGRQNGVWESIRRVVAWIFGFHPPPPNHRQGADDSIDSEFADYLDNINGDEPEHADSPPPPPEHRFIGAVPCSKLGDALKRMRRVNKLLSSFERGFISESGIKDREWYKHLVVAPGKWLGAFPFISSLSCVYLPYWAAGYGATTFPALTEAITIEQNATLAEYEAARLQGLIDKLASHIRV